jgi:hypothetical protein
MAPVVGIALAVAAHVLNNALPLLSTLADVSSSQGPPQQEAPVAMGFIKTFVDATLIQVTIYWPLILLMAIAVWRSGVWERRVIREQLTDEVGRAVTANEYRDVLRDGIFRTRRTRPIVRAYPLH